MPAYLPLSLAIIFGLSVLAPWLCRRLETAAPWILATAPLGAFLLLLSQIGIVAGGAPVVYEAAWFSSLGMRFDLRLDGLSLLMGLLVTGIGVLVVVYAGAYMKGDEKIGRFYLFLLAFMGAMLGLLLADNMLLLFVFWELTSITSYLLIGFKHEEKASRWKALQALLVTGLGAMAMLAGFILIAEVTGSYSISAALEAGELLRGSPFYTAIVLLILGGAFTKSAQVPFHFWLPNAMAAPTPVSAYLHSATMVKAGVFLLARFTPALGGGALWHNSLMIFGGATLLLAVLLGLFHRDLKSILAYTTLAVLGMLTMLIGLGDTLAIKAMVGFLLGHALYKAALFMTAGAVDHETGTRDVSLLGGLRRKMPMTALAAGLAALSMSGLAPFFGFIGKELVYKAAVVQDGALLLVLVSAFAGNFLMLALAFNAGFVPFWSRKSPDGLPKKPHEAPAAMWLGPLVLALLGLAFGLFPTMVGSHLVGPAAESILGRATVPVKLALWHGFNLPLLLSLLTLVAGLGVFALRKRFWACGDRVLAAIRPFGAEAAYERLFNATIQLSKIQTRCLQTGRLHDYVFMIVLATVGLLLWAVLNYGGLRFSIDWAEFDLLMMGLVLIMIVATVMAATASEYITVLVSLGTVGFGIALIFVYYGAPDLAITQLLVETLTVVLFMFVIFRLPPLTTISSGATRLRDAFLASVFGGLITLLVLKAVNIQFNHAISDQLAAMSYPEAKGRNVVNVILVDFRALDTLGEITVIAIAALGIAALVFAGKRQHGKGGQ